MLQREIIAPLSGDCSFSWFPSPRREIDGEMTGHVLHVKYFMYIQIVYMRHQQVSNKAVSDIFTMFRVSIPQRSWEV